MLSSNYIVSWNSSTYVNLGTGLNGRCKTLTTDNSGNLYVGGNFTNAGGVSANYIAVWNGSSWSTLGSGLSYNCYSIAYYDSTHIYAAGRGSNPSQRYISRWDGSSWNNLPDIGGFCNSLALDNSGNLYAGGGSFSGRVKMWDGVSWNFLGSGLNATVETLVYDTINDLLYVGGDFTTAGGSSANYVAKWNPNTSTWSALGSGLDYFCFSLSLDSSGNLYAGGNFVTAGGSPANFIAKWDGSNWSALGSGFNTTVNALDIDVTNNLYAGGFFTTAGGNPANRIAKWNGSNWFPLGGGVDNTVYSLTSNNSGTVYLGGDFTQSFQPPYPCFAENSKLLCFKDDKEVYIPIQELRKGDFVKTYKHGYKQIDMIGTTKIYNYSTERIPERLYILRKDKYPELNEDLILTGYHAILVDQLTHVQKEKILEIMKGIYITDDKYRLIACVDDRADLYLEKGEYNIYHISLENDDYFMNYGVYANGGLLVETCSKRYLKELSNMKLL